MVCPARLGKALERGLGGPRRFARVAAALLMAWPHAVSAESRRLADLEPVTLYFAPGGETRSSVATVGVTLGFPVKGVIPYVGGGLGLLTVQARAGVSFLPNALAEPGFLIRTEARPQLFLGRCVGPGLVGNVGIGYRWPLEHSYPGEPAGTAFYVLPTFDGGRAWIAPRCTKTGPIGDREGTWLYGGSLALGLDW